MIVLDTTVLSLVYRRRRSAQTDACRASGVAATTIDCLIAAQTIAARARLFTTDKDFTRIAPHCGLRLFGAADVQHD